jgi:hypothetical protein
MLVGSFILFLGNHKEQVGATRALHVSNQLLSFFFSFFLSFFLSADLPPPRPLPPTVCMPSLSLSLFLRLKICALLDIYIGDEQFLSFA